MESKNPSIQIDMLDDSNYHFWKIRIQHVLALKDLENFLEEDPPSDSAQLATWTKKDKKAQAIIGLTLSNDLLENVREVNSTKDMWIAILDVKINFLDISPLIVDIRISIRRRNAEGIRLNFAEFDISGNDHFL